MDFFLEEEIEGALMDVVFGDDNEDQDILLRKGSMVGKSPNVNRDRVERHRLLMHDYFMNEPVFNEKILHRRYRIPKQIFMKLMHELCRQNSFWRLKKDCTGLPGLSPEQKLTAVFRMLAYGAPADAKKRVYSCSGVYCT
jgi:hypothetical protein